MSVFTAPNAFAICNPGRGIDARSTHRFSGAYNFSPINANYEWTESAAAIPYYTPFVDFAHRGGEAVWPMLADYNCQLGFGQIGELEGTDFANHSYPYSRTFIEVEQCNPYVAFGPFFWPTPGPSTHLYKVQHSPPYTGILQVITDVTPYYANGGTSVNWYANNIEYFSENHAQDDQNYGGYSNQQLISQVSACLTYVGGGSACGSPLLTEQHTAPWMANSMAPGSVAYRERFTVWDTACPT